MPDPLDPSVTVYQPGDHSGETMAGTVYFAPGVHSVDQLTAVASNTLIYLAGGSVVYGSFLTAAQSHNVRIDGRGVLSAVV